MVKKFTNISAAEAKNATNAGTKYVEATSTLEESAGKVAEIIGIGATEGKTNRGTVYRQVLSGRYDDGISAFKSAVEQAKVEEQATNPKSKKLDAKTLRRQLNNYLAQATKDVRKAIQDQAEEAGFAHVNAKVKDVDREVHKHDKPLASDDRPKVRAWEISEAQKANNIRFNNLDKLNVKVKARLNKIAGNRIKVADAVLTEEKAEADASPIAEAYAEVAFLMMQLHNSNKLEKVVAILDEAKKLAR